VPYAKSKHGAAGMLMQDLPSFRRIQALPGSMMTMLDEVLRQCGFIGTLIVGGPDPELPNQVISMIFQSGKTMTGMTFSEAYPELKVTMTNSFNTFAHKCLGVCFWPSYCHICSSVHGSYEQA
jgi:hypothetical protein